MVAVAESADPPPPPRKANDALQAVDEYSAACEALEARGGVLWGHSEWGFFSGKGPGCRTLGALLCL